MAASMTYPHNDMTSSTMEISASEHLPTDPLVSVYMATYNHDRYISRAIEGVLSQETDFQIELIIGEDHSTDRTLEIVCEYQIKYPKLIRIITGPVNVGGFCNSNRCLPRCRGKYIAFCEGDDYWHRSDKLRMQVDAMVASSTVTMCHTDYNRQIGSRIKRSAHSTSARNPIQAANAFHELLFSWNVMTATVMYRADVIRQFLNSEFNRPDWPFGDYNKALFAAAHGEVIYLPVSTATWRKVRGSATTQTPRRMLLMRQAARECRELFLHCFPVPERVRTASLARANRILLDAAFDAIDTKAYLDALTRLRELNASPPRIVNWLRRLALRLYVPALVMQGVRRATLYLTTL